MSEQTKLAIRAAERGRIGEAFATLSNAASGRDPAAAYLLAQWRMRGDLIRRDLSEARRLYGIAAQFDYADAESTYLALLANGAGGSERRWHHCLTYMREHSGQRYIEECSLLDQMEIDKTGDPTTLFTMDRAFSNPCIQIIRNFLSSAECEYLIRLAKPKLQRSQVVHPATGALIEDPVRNSSAVAFPFVLENPVIHAINRRIAYSTSTTYEQGEPAQVLAYDVGQEYKTHSDALPSSENQRILTVLVYLNDDYAGGETKFDELGWGFKGSQGDALIFRNTEKSGQPNPLAVHRGGQVTAGQKFLLSKWIRESPLSLEGPPGKPF